MDKGCLPLLFLSFFIQTAYSCSCMLSGFDSGLCRYDLVFRGTAISEKAPLLPYSFDDRIYTFRVEKIFWARNQFEEIQSLNMSTPSNGALCGSYFQLNTAQVISAYHQAGRWRTTLCYRNQIWSTVAEGDKDFLSTALKRSCSQQAL